MFLPYRVDVPMARWPIANFVLIGLTILISVAMFGPLDEWEASIRGNAAMSPEIVQAMHDAGIEAQAQGYPAVVDQFLLQPGHFRFMQLFGHLLVHEGFWHLAGNMLFLFVFGNAVNAKLGHGKFLLLYFGVGVIEALAWLLLGPHMPCLGASGAIMGIIGAYVVLYPLNDVSVAYMFTFVYTGVYQISGMWIIAMYVAFDLWGLISGRNTGVAYLLHVVGFASGAALATALLWYKMVEMEQDEKSLLQMWKWMPHVEDTRKTGSLMNPQAARASIAGLAPGGKGAGAPPRPPLPPRKPRDEGPIPLD